jgi:predicted N-acetyltransferase YhbS
MTVSDTAAAALAASPLDHVLIRTEAPADFDAVETMQAQVFGPGRFARTAFRIREGVPADAETSFVAEIDGRIVGSVRLTRISIGATPALLLGPLAVSADQRGQGVGSALMRLSLDAARRHHHKLVLLVGDLPFYWPFGFRVVPAGRVAMPGPVDPGRLLWAELATGASDGVGGAVAAKRG